MSRPNLARLEPSAYTVLSVADPEKVVTTTGQVLGELDLDHLCRLLIRSERSLSLVNRRSFAAALADVPALPNQAMRPAPPFADAVASAREDGKLLERTRQFLAQNPRALEELTPELTLALLRHFDPSMRMRPSPFTRHVIAVGSVTAIALVAAVLGIVHTQQNDAIAAKNTEAQIAQIEREQHAPAVRQPHEPVSVRTQYQYHPIVIPPTVAINPPVVPQIHSTVVSVPVPLAHSRKPATVTVGPVVPAPIVSAPAASTSPDKYTALFVPPAVQSTAGPAAANSTAAAQTATGPQTQAAVPNGAAVTSLPSGSTNVTPVAGDASSAQSGAAATALVLRTIVAQNPNANVEWIRASKASDHVVTVTTRVHNNDAVSQDTYQLYNSDGQLTVINHQSSTP